MVTMAGTFNTSFVTEIILKLPELNHSAYVKCHLTDKLKNIPDCMMNYTFVNEQGRIYEIVSSYL